MKFTAKGRIRLLRDGVEISQHVVPEEAYERAYAHAQANGPGKYIVRYPDREVDLSTLTRVVFNPDTTAPSVPLGVTVSPISQTTLRVTWSASTDTGGSGLAGYRVYRATTSGGTYAQIGSDLSTASLSFDDTSLVGGTTRYYRVAAFDGNGNVSAQSSVASGTTPAASTSFDYYISPTGSDSNDGSLGSPWAITALNTKRATYAGKVVGLVDGTYDVSSLNETARSFGSPLFNIAGGSSGSPTVIRAVTPRGAWIQAKTPGGDHTGIKTTPFFNGYFQSNEGGVLANVGSVGEGYLTLDGLRVSGDTSTLVRIGAYQSPDGTTYDIPGIIIENCEFFDTNESAQNNGTQTGSNNSALQLFLTDGAIIRNNYFHDLISWNDTTTDHLSSVLCWHCRGTVLEYNTAIQASAFLGKHVGCQGTIIRYNYISETRAGAAVADFVPGFTSATQATEIYGNVTITGTSGLHLRSITGNTEGWTTALRVYNNTIIQDAVGINQQHFTAWSDDDGIGALEFYNNIMAGDLSIDRKMVAVNALAWGKCGYNVFPNSGTRWRVLDGSTGHPDTGGQYNTLTNYRNAIAAAGGLSASLMELGSVETSQTISALFELDVAGPEGYRLKSGSAAINAGKSDGTSGGSTVDAGAWGLNPSRIGADFVSYS